MKDVTMWWGSLAPWLLIFWFIQRLPFMRGWRGASVSAAMATVLLLIPWSGHALPWWSRSLSANFSVIMAVLLVLGIVARARAKSCLRPDEWCAAWVFGAVGSVLLYPSALGLGPQNFDAYSLGWPWLFWGQSFWLFGIVALTASLLIWRGNRFGFVVMLALIGYAIRFQESQNVWDYLLDPVYGAVSILIVLWTLARRFIPRSR